MAQTKKAPRKRKGTKKEPITNVSDAIQLVLTKIKCLKALVKIIQNPKTDNAPAVYAKLIEFFPEVELIVTGQERFHVCLRDGVVTMKAVTLVDYYDSLSGSHKKKGKGNLQEWTP